MISIDTNGRTIIAALGVVLLSVSGVVAFGWNFRVLLVLYWMEVGVVLLSGVVAALFAVRPVGEPNRWFLPLGRLLDKRGSVRLLGRLPPIHPRNVPFVMNTLIVLCTFWPLGLVAIAALGDSVTLPTATWSSVAVASLALVLRETVTRVEWLREGRYTDESPLSVLPRGHLVGLATLAFGGLGLALSVESVYLDRTAVLGLVIVVKLSFDLPKPFDTDSIPLTGQLGADLVGRDDQIRVPAETPTARFTPDRRSLRNYAVGLGLILVVCPPTSLVLASGSLLAGITIGIVPAVLFALVVVGIRVWIENEITCLRFGNVEYRVYPEVVLAYDTGLDAPQWSVRISEVSSVKTKQSAFARWFGRGYSSVVLETRSGETRRLRFVSDPDEIVASVEARTRTNADSVPNAH